MNDKNELKTLQHAEKNEYTISLETLLNPDWISNKSFLKRKLNFIRDHIVQIGECNFFKVKTLLEIFSKKSSQLTISENEDLKTFLRVTNIFENEVPKYNFFTKDENYDMHAEPNDEKFEKGGGYVNITRSLAYFNDWFPSQQQNNQQHLQIQKIKKLQTILKQNSISTLMHSNSNELNQSFSDLNHNTESNEEITEGSRRFNKFMKLYSNDSNPWQIANWNLLWKYEPDVIIGKNASDTSLLDKNVFQQIIHSFNKLDRHTIENQDIYLKTYSLDFKEEALNDIVHININDISTYKYLYFLYLRELDRNIFLIFDENMINSTQNLLNFHHKINWPTIKSRDQMIYMSEKMINYLSIFYYLPWEHKSIENQQIIFPWIQNTKDIFNFKILYENRRKYLQNSDPNLKVFIPDSTLFIKKNSYNPNNFNNSINHNNLQLDLNEKIDTIENQTNNISIVNSKLVESFSTFEEKNQQNEDFYFKQKLIFLQQKQNLFEFYKKKMIKNIMHVLEKKFNHEKKLDLLNERTKSRLNTIILQFKLLSLKKNIQTKINN